ncbi:hypothetical protein PT287_09650 [Lactobacillus sp. ESL0679]|uniref:hypothetical protein n=1 Tax=Lactobacillus sp. ESL0679 TaxID=2983209 RepID=UPI0023F7A5C3|nr:hypothetical protein [Lactobacillus sp. ESL0679]MDF7683761.1 hypothetical protein [Lactobacillus sp. ESL0679]
MTDSETENKLICPFLIIVILVNSWEWYKLSRFYKTIVTEYYKCGGIYNFWNAQQIVGTTDYKNAAWCGGIVLVMTSIAAIWGIRFIINKSKSTKLRVTVFILLLVSFIIAYFAVKYWFLAVVIVAAAAGALYGGYGNS